MKKIVHRAGLRALATPVCETEDDLMAALRPWTLAALVEMGVETAKDVLRRAGLPDQLGMYLTRDDGSWMPVPRGWLAMSVEEQEAAAVAAGAGVANLLTLVGDAPTKERDAAEVLEFHAGFLEAREARRHDDAYWHLLRLGDARTMLLAELAGWHRSAVVRAKAEAPLGDHNSKRRQRPPQGDEHARWLERDEELKRDRPGWKADARAKKIKKEIGRGAPSAGWIACVIRGKRRAG